MLLYFQVHDEYWPIGLFTFLEGNGSGLIKSLAGLLSAAPHVQLEQRLAGRRRIEFHKKRSESFVDTIASKSGRERKGFAADRVDQLPFGLV